MKPEDSLRSAETPGALPDQPLAGALHRALERAGRGEPARLEELLPGDPPAQKRLAELLQTAGRLDQFVRLVEEESGVRVVPTEEVSTQEYEPPPGARLPQPFPGEYQVRALLGEGSFGQVWLADHLRLGRQVALKALRLRGGVEQRSRALAALQNEARLLAQLEHPNVVRVHDLRQAGDQHYLVLQYVPGQSLKARLEARGPLDWRRAARYVADAAEALVHVHSQGIVHRDIKPANLLWDEEKEEVLLTDFGVSAWLAEAATGKTAAGTLWYMAPEAFRGRGGLAADVFSLAATLFHLLTGAPPFPAPSSREMPAWIARGLPDPDPRCEEVPPRLERVIRAGLKAEPERRPTLQAFVAGLRGALNQLLADSLPAAGAGPGTAPPSLRLIVARRGGDGSYVPVAATRCALPRATRNLTLVPPEPEGVALRTGDRVRIEVVAERDGYVTVFNVGPKGDLTLLYPEEAPAPAPANRPLHVTDVMLTPPAGGERLFAVWSREALPLALAELARQVAGEAGPVSRSYQATRNLERVRESVQRLGPEDWQAAVLELDHRPA
jgi:hypothetical protein